VTAAWLADARVEPDVFALRPDYRALLLLAEDLVPGPSDELIPPRPASFRPGRRRP